MQNKIIDEILNNSFDNLCNWKKAIKLSNIDKNGFGYLSIEILNDNNLSYLIPTNGKTWERSAEKYFYIERVGSGLNTKGWYINGLKNNKLITYSVPNNVKSLLKNQYCQIINTKSQLEIDHKYEYMLYNNDDFNKNPKNYQKIHRVFNSKKREERINRDKTGYKYNNTNSGLAFITTKNNLKHNISDISLNNPYDGDFWTDPKETLKLDRQLYCMYYLKCIKVGLVKENDFKFFEEHIVPKINKICTDSYSINSIDSIIEIILNSRK